MTSKLKFNLKLCVFSLNQKLEVALILQKHRSTGYEKVVQEGTPQGRHRLMLLCFSSQNVVLPSEK